VTIRAARPDDAPKLQDLMRRLREGSLPAWRHPTSLEDNLTAAEAGFFGPLAAERTLLVCVDDSDTPIGFAQAMMDKDFFSGAPQGHLLFLVTDRAHEGRGVARSLMAGVEDWARAHGATGLLLHVFATNDTARAAYHRFGFQEDMVKMVKPLGQDVAEPKRYD
jgi:GNAT superfamily N-acetyltransferase